MSMNVKEIVKAVKAILGNEEQVEIDLNDPRIAPYAGEFPKAKVRFELTKEYIAVRFPKAGGDKVIIHQMRGAKGASDPDSVAGTSPEKSPTEPKSRPAPKRHQHSYVAPKIAKKIIAAMTDEASLIPWLGGPTQCGKTALVKYLGEMLSRKVFQINCRGDMGSEHFFGEQTVEVDPASKQNHIVFKKGVIEQAMVEGLDKDGNEVGEPSILFIDELPAAPAHVVHGLNRLFESDDPRRTLVIDMDGGRVIRSHSRFRIIVAGNTFGRGSTGTADSVYTAQMDALDMSLLHRISLFFRMGYNRMVEKHILIEKVGDDAIVEKILTFRDGIRDHIRAGKLSTPFSTKNIVDIANAYRIYGDLGEAVYQSIMESLAPEEKAIYNEQAMAVIGRDLVNDYVEDDVDYM